MPPPWSPLIMVPPPAAAPGAGAPMAAMGYSTSTVPAWSNFSVALTRLALLQRMFQIEQHDVKAAGLQRDGLARLDFQAALDRAHFHHAVFHGHGVDLALRALASLDTQLTRSGAVPLLVMVI